MLNSPPPKAGSYESFLSEEQCDVLHALLLSPLPLQKAREQAPLWADGSENRRPSIPCLWRIRVRLRLEEKLRQLEETRLTERVLRQSLRELATHRDPENLLDQLTALLSHQIIESSLGGEAGHPARVAAARLLLRRADQRRQDRALALKERVAAQSAPPEQKVFAALRKTFADAWPDHS